MCYPPFKASALSGLYIHIYLQKVREVDVPFHICLIRLSLLSSFENSVGNTEEVNNGYVVFKWNIDESAGRWWGGGVLHEY